MAVVVGCSAWSGCAGSADAGSITRTGASRSEVEPALRAVSGSVEEAIIKPAPKPTARITNVVPTPAKKMRAFDDTVVYSRCQRTLDFLHMFRLRKNRCRLLRALHPQKRLHRLAQPHGHADFTLPRSCADRFRRPVVRCRHSAVLGVGSEINAQATCTESARRFW